MTPIGTGQSELWQALLEGRTGFAPVESFDTSAYRVHVGAEIGDFDSERWCQRLPPQRLGRASKLGIAAARLALADAGLDPENHDTRELDPGRCGIAMGTTSGEPNEIERFDDLFVAGRVEEVGAELLDRYPCHLIAAHMAAELGFSGPNLVLPAACAAGNHAIAHAFDALRWVRAEVMLAGGADAFSRIAYTGFARLGAIAPDVCRPFDKNRKGMIPGEGAAVLVLEPEERARKRGAAIYAQVLGYGLSCDAHHMTAAHPEGEGAVRAMEQALAHAGLDPGAVGYISAHGTGTATNDRLETIAIKRVFGERAYDLPVSSIKSVLGHTMGAASAIEAAVCALAIRHGCVPPTRHLEERDPECDLDYVSEGPRELEVDVVMNNAYAFGGNNASLVLGRHRGSR